ncbi:PAS domain-containing sensor histidine kinase [Lysinibacillus sp. 2017]|nr:ATP-binding protein [Lysinibacillus sp. S2017]AWE06484.1 PAS domain-containing sensor histidine kinase [Lysinibacillus sp. 2017]TGN32248.1 PAS domain S-box protein [Lysinibacillus sp. S2017]
MQYEILQKRNIFTLITYLFSNLVVTLAIISQQFQNNYTYLYFCGISTLLLLAFYFFKIPPKAFQISLVISWHILIFLYNCQSINTITLYGFIYLFGVLTIYRSLLLNFINILFVTIEIIILVKSSIMSLTILNTQENHLFLIFLLIVCIISLVQSLSIKRIWSKMEQKTLAREYDLNSKQAYLNLFFEHAEDAIAVFDMEDRVIAVNPAFEKLYGWTKEEAIGNALPLIPPIHLKGAKTRCARLREGKSYTFFETQDMRKDGTVFDAQISLSPILNPHGEIIASSVISRDISYIKENENLIVQSEKMKLVGELAAGVAHEIRNPMTVISGFVQMMNEDASSPYYEYTKLIQTETERIDLILAEFLVLSRPQVKQFTPINLAEILAEVTQLFQFEFQQKSITLKMINPYKNTIIMGNENQIKQVFINLIKNAIEAISEKGTIKLEMCKSSDEKSIYITIKDTGCGIPPHVLERVFEPFYTTKSKGTGLGMMIINKVIQDHQGTIKIKSKQNMGTEILLSFPVEQH